MKKYDIEEQSYQKMEQIHYQSILNSGRLSKAKSIDKKLRDLISDIFEA